MRNRAQIDAALIRANAIRDARAELKARVKPLSPEDGRFELAAILEEGHADVLARLPVTAYLRWSRRMLGRLLDRYLAEVEASEFRVVGDLTDRQRGLLIDALRMPVETLLERQQDRDRYGRHAA